jgi:WD40 repeat protein
MSIRPSRMPTLPAMVVVAGLLVSTFAADASAAGWYPATGGDELWRARYDGPANSTDSGEDIAVSPDGSLVFVTGSSWGGTTTDFLTIAYDRSTGQVVWLRREDWGVEDHAVAIAVSPDGETVYVTGNRAPAVNRSVWVTVAYAAATGAVRWISRFQGPESKSYTSNLAVSPDGSLVFVTGEADRTEALDYDITTVAYDSSTGEVRWVRAYGTGHSEWAVELAVSPDGAKVFVAGYTQVSLFPLHHDWLTLAYDTATGATLWRRVFDGRSHGDDAAEGVAISPDGSTVFVSGSSDGTAEASSDFLTVAYASSTGVVRWARRSDAGGWELARDVALSGDGRVLVVAGTTRPSAPEDGDYLTIAYDAITGAPRWARRYDGPATEFHDDIIYDIVVAPDGSSVFVAGWSDGVGPYHHTDWATIAYDLATGTVRWVARYAAPNASFDLVNAIAVSPDSGAVYVTGSRGRNNAVDFETVAYEA